MTQYLFDLINVMSVPLFKVMLDAQTLGGTFFKMDDATVSYFIVM